MPVKIQNKAVEAWVNECVAMCQPDKVVLCTGSKEEYDKLMQEMVASGLAIPLNPEKRPNSFLFRTDPSDVARVEDRTFIASKKKEDAGPTNNWVEPSELKAEMTKLYTGSMRGRTMYIIPYCMGPLGSPMSKIGFELTDSPYVVVSMYIMTRVGTKTLEALGDSEDFVRGLHSVGVPLAPGEKDQKWPCRPVEEKYISQFPEERLIWSFGSGYGGNALLGKKCFALRIASVQARDEGWMAEHMLIMKMTNSAGDYKYFTASFPSACGKTNLAMLKPTIPGWKVETLGDDIAWLKYADDGRLHAINPEKGCFGVAPGTSYQSNSSAMEMIKKNTIFTNVALTDDGDVWWEGIDGEKPAHLIDWQGNDWTPESTTPAAHANARFTAPVSQCPIIAPEWETPEGVPISAMLVGGRRPSRIPLVYESRNWQHGVFMGSIMGSEITAATISDNIGQVRRDPFAMLPFMGYNIGDYLQHWLDIGKATTPDKLPKLYSVNWFRKGSDGHFEWPGFGENSRVLEWIFDRVSGKGHAVETAVGALPAPEDIDSKGLDVSPEDLADLLTIDKDEWLAEVASIKESYAGFGDKLPHELFVELDHLEARLNA